MLDTGLFDHAWLEGVQHTAAAHDVWDVDHDGYGDNESGHGTFIAGLILQVAPAAEVTSSRCSTRTASATTHGRRGDGAAAAGRRHRQPLARRLHDDDAAPLAIACALNAMRKQRNVVVAAAGNAGKSRPFWPAAFKQVLAAGAVDEKDAHWAARDFSNYGWWVDAAARGVNLQSTFTKGKTKVARARRPTRADPWIAFDGWAAWDGTSFASPITAAMLARAMSRNGFATPPRRRRTCCRPHRPRRSPTSRSRSWWTSSTNCS